MLIVSTTFIGLLALAEAMLPPLLQPPSVEDATWKLLQFSERHTEWVPEDMIHYLGIASASTPAPRGYPTCAEMLKYQLFRESGVSDTAKRALCDRENTKKRFIDITDSIATGFIVNPSPEIREKYNVLEMEHSLAQQTPMSTSYLSSWANLVYELLPVQSLVGDLPYKAPNASRHSHITEWKPNSTALEETIHGLSVGFSTRYYKSSSARPSANWLKEKLQGIINLHPSARTQVTEISNAGYDQPNLIAVIPGTSPELPRVVIGAHYDSIASLSRFFPGTSAPGADDDATGIATILETARLLSVANYTGTRTIEFHAYSGEEAGLLGSGTVARLYKSQKIGVHGMLQMEMNGYQPTAKSGGWTQSLLGLVGLNTKPFTSIITVPSDPQPDFSNYVAALAKQYAPTARVVVSECEYGCSDHYSFHLAGYRAGTVAEAGPEDKTLNPSIHTSGDSMDKLNFEAMVDFVKVAVGFVVELAE